MEIKEYVEKHTESLVNFLREMVFFKTVSSQKDKYEKDIKEFQDFMKRIFDKHGFKSQILKTKGVDSIFAQKIVDESKPTMLFYGHYDVVAAKKEDGWDQEDPFNLEVKGDRMIGRGVADNKGPISAFLNACFILEKLEGSLPVNVKIVLEGEEEIGSLNFNECVKENKELLKASHIVMADSSWVDTETPAINLGNRGVTYFSVKVKGPDNDVHSGVYGGVIENPHNVVTKILASLTDQDGKVLVPGFYDDVYKLTDTDIAELEIIPLDIEKFREEGANGKLLTDDKLEILKRNWTLPCFDIHGICGGFTEDGQKTIIPSYCEGKFSFRTVNNQDPEKIAKATIDFIKKQVPDAEVTVMSNAYPYAQPIDSKEITRAIDSYRVSFDLDPVFSRTGGTYGSIYAFDKILNMPILMLGIIRSDCSMHSPNETMRIENYKKGVVLFYDYLKRCA